MRPVSLRAARRAIERHPAPRRHRRHPLVALAALLGGATVAALLWWPSMVGTALGALQREAGAVLVELELHGAVRLDVATVQEVLDLEPGVPLLTVDLDDARARLEALGWVEQATVRRELPGKLLVEVKEHRPLAVWLGPEGPALVTASGRAVSAEDLADHLELPRLVGDAAPALAPPLLRRLARHPTLLARLERLEHLPSDRWRLTFAPGVVVELAPGDVEPQLRRLAELATGQGLLDRAVAVVDLRAADRLVVTPWPVVRNARAAGGGGA